MLIFPQSVAKYIDFYNEMRPCYALGYDIPNHYEQRYWNDELEKKDTFRNRVLSETPKFVQKKMSTFIDWYNALILDRKKCSNYPVLALKKCKISLF